jgi:Predicted glycosyltransferases
MKIHIAVVTMGQQGLIDRLFSPLFWRSLGQNVVDSIVVLSQLQPVTISVPENAPNVIVKCTVMNYGCAGARALITNSLLSAGLQAQDIIIYLDDDVEVETDYWLADLISPLHRHYSISGVAGRRVTADTLTEVDCENPDYVSGGWCAIRGDVFLDGCMFDERFFPNYYEDIDLCYQAREKGKQIICVGNIGLRHEHPISDEAARHVSENRKRFIEKWKTS